MAFGVWLGCFRETELAVPRKTACPSQCMGAPSCARISHPVYLPQEDDITFRRPLFLGQGSQFALGTGLSGIWSRVPTRAVTTGGAPRYRSGYTPDVRFWVVLPLTQPNDYRTGGNWA